MIKRSDWDYCKTCVAGGCIALSDTGCDWHNNPEHCKLAEEIEQTADNWTNGNGTPLSLKMYKWARQLRKQHSKINLA